MSFTKTDAKRYSIAITRDQGPALLPRFGPGYDDLMPHDLAHYLVEEYFRIQLGVWGQLAAGGGGIFFPAPEDNSLQWRRRVQRLGAIGREDMVRSEELVVLIVSAWERSIGRVKHQTRHVRAEVERDKLRGAVDRMAAVAEQWRALPHGGSLDFEWPEGLTLKTARSRRGRRHRTLESARR